METRLCTQKTKTPENILKYSPIIIFYRIRGELDKHTKIIEKFAPNFNTYMILSWKSKLFIISLKYVLYVSMKTTILYPITCHILASYLLVPSRHQQPLYHSYLPYRLKTHQTATPFYFLCYSTLIVHYWTYSHLCN